MQTFFLFQFQKVLCIVTFFWKNGGLEDMLHMLYLDDNILQLGKFQSVVGKQSSSNKSSKHKVVSTKVVTMKVVTT